MRLFDMQHSCYSKAVRTIVEVVGERYFHAERVLRCRASMSIEVRQLDTFDHRTVQNMHDLIAAWYRFKRRTEHLFPLEPKLKEHWLRFLVEETLALSKEADFVTGVLDACIHANTDVGHAGEKRAMAVQRFRYREMLLYTFPRSQPEVGAKSASEDEIK